jgi:cyclophilin family peptidyl-prolyl cis-trans isomerase
MGDIRIELDAAKAPITTKNFVDYVSAGHYDGLIFHRVIPGFMIQGGGMDAAMNEKKNGAPIKNEAANGLKNDVGTIAMARTNVVDSATSQFFINVKNNDFLNHRSTAAADRLRRLRSGNRRHGCRSRYRKSADQQGPSQDVPTQP